MEKKEVEPQTSEHIGQLCYVKRVEGYKLSARLDKYKFVGYPKKSME